MCAFTSNERRFARAISTITRELVHSALIQVIGPCLVARYLSSGFAATRQDLNKAAQSEYWHIACVKQVIRRTIKALTRLCACTVRSALLLFSYNKVGFSRDGAQMFQGFCSILIYLTQFQIKLHLFTPINMFT